MSDTEPKATDKALDCESHAPDLAAWRAAVPVCESACPPDGKHPPLAFPIMLGGVIVTALAGIAGAAVGGGIVALFFGCGAAMPDTINWAKLIIALGTFGNVIIFVSIAIFSFFGILLTTLWLIPIFMRLARNRAGGTAFGYALLASILAAVAFKVAVVMIAEPNAPSIRQIGLLEAVRYGWGVTTWDRILTTIWVILTGLLSALAAWAAAMDGRFCTHCNGRALRHLWDKRVSYGLLREIVAALTERDVPRLRTAFKRNVMKKLNAAGGRIDLYQCRGCGRVLVEATAVFVKETERGTWLAGSMLIESEESEGLGVTTSG